MALFRRESFEPRVAEVAAAEAPLTNEPFLPDNLDIVVFYGGHSDRKDFAVLAPHLASADVFVPELTHWTASKVELFSRISQGDKGARSELEISAGGKFNPFTAAEVKWLLGNGVYITPIDYAAHHEGADKILDHFQNWGLIGKLVPSFDKSLDAIDRYAREEAKIEDQRESIMLRSIGPRLQTLIDSSPELAAKDRIKVVIQQGAAHTYFYHDLRKLVAASPTCTAERVFDGPVLFEHFDRLTRAYRADVQLTKQERRELAMRALARVGLRFAGNGGIDYVLEPGENILRLPPPEVMVDRIAVSAIQDFHRRITASRQRS